jgi:Xaa-Pro aminopeptidase
LAITAHLVDLLRPGRRRGFVLGATALAWLASSGLAPRPAAGADAPLAPARPFPPTVYQARRAKLMKALGGGIAVLHARGEEDADGYRQDGDFYYLTGLNEPGAVLVLSPEERVYKERLFLKPRNPDDERWTGVRPDISDSLRRATGIESIARTTSLGGAVMGLLRTSRTLHLISAPGDPDSPAGPEMTLYGKLSSRLPGVGIKDRTDLLPAMRSVKEPRELEYMEKAIAATAAAHRVAARAIRPGVEENWVAGLIDLEFKRGGAVRPAFPPIVGAGANSTILHYPEHARPIAPGSLVVVDIGSDYGRYAADVTRTYPADGRFTPEQRRIYDLVLRAQQTCIEMIRPGVYYEDLQRKAEEIIREAGYRDYFIHGLGHFVGLDVHDSGLYKKPLAAGMVITIEPGVYIPEKSLGVRIEDEVLVTPKGHRLLTADLPRDADSIERMMREP